MTPLRKVDHSALRTNQVLIISLLVLAFVLDSPVLVAFVAAVMVIGALFPSLRLFVWVYRTLLKPANLVRPDVHPDNPEPHRFAMALGGIVTTLSTLALFAGQPVMGWSLSFVVIALAGLNLFAGFCAGCFLYYQFNRLGVPGFDQAPVQES